MAMNPQLRRFLSRHLTLLNDATSFSNPCHGSILDVGLFLGSQSQQRQKTTGTSLSASFNSKASLMTSFAALRTKGVNVGLFGIPELATPAGFAELEARAISRTQELVDEATSSRDRRRRNVVPIFDDISDTLCRVADLADFVRVSHPNPEFANAAANACASICALVENLNTNAAIYSALEKALAEGDVNPVDEMERRVGELLLFDFQQSGIQLPEKQRQRFVQLNEAIHTVGNRFSQNASLGRSVSRSVLPKHLHNAFVTEGDNLVVNGLHSDAQQDWKREAAYRLFLYPEQEQEHLLSQLLSLRHELALSAGFSTFAHRALNNKMIGTPDNAKSFLETLASELKLRSQKEISCLKSIKAAHNGVNPKSVDIDAWDPDFYVFTSAPTKIQN